MSFARLISTALRFVGLLLALGTGGLVQAAEALVETRAGDVQLVVSSRDTWDVAEVVLLVPEAIREARGDTLQLAAVRTQVVAQRLGEDLAPFGATVSAEVEYPNARLRVTVLAEDLPRVLKLVVARWQEAHSQTRPVLPGTVPIALLERAYIVATWPQQSSVKPPAKASGSSVQGLLFVVAGPWSSNAVSAMLRSSLPPVVTGPVASPATADSVPAFCEAGEPSTGTRTLWLRMESPGPSSMDWAAGRLAQAVLGAGFKARLNATLRDQLGLVYGAGASIRYLQGRGLVLATTRADAGKLLVVADELQHVVEGLEKHPPSAQELANAQQLLVENFVDNRATPSAEAALIATYLAAGFSLEAFVQVPQRLAEVSLEALRQQAVRLTASRDGILRTQASGALCRMELVGR